MLLWVVRILYVFVSAGAIATLVKQSAAPPSFIEEHPLLAFFGLLAISQLATLIDLLTPRKRIEIISAVYFGLLIGTLLSYLMILALDPVLAALNVTEYSGVVRTIVTLMLVYLSTSLILQTKDDFRFVIPYVEFSRELRGRKPLILDSSALIDGRIADVVETGVIDAKLIVPDFILREVQEIADSNDRTRRNRGRRGLDILRRLQESPKVEVEVLETERGPRGQNVDQRLIALAKKLGGQLLTSDFNLNKVAKVQGVEVINLNDLAAALRPRFLPGETLKIRVIKEGESPGQGVGYLDDGTMVVCENAAHRIGEEIECVVTTVLQSSAGRMIFVKPGTSLR
ncbi:MAG: TRAM domain-containing protein [Planctomycetota bacterium]|nr:MAG: TRAM domain-containing protein [Planctomycetota bacterium]